MRAAASGGGAAVVSGGASGIGAAICRRLGESKAFRAVGVIDLDGAAAGRTAAELRRAGAAAASAEADVTDSAAVQEAVDSLASEFGGLDAVAAAAGNLAGAPVEEMTPAVWSSVIETHLTGSYALVKAAVPALRKSPAGSVVLISSIASRGIPGKANYGAAKAGVIGLARSLAMELGPDGIRVNAVAPGFIDTPMTRNYAERSRIPWEEFAGRSAAASALGRIGAPEEVAAAVNFLAGPAAGYITGQVLFVTGGP